MNFQTFTKRMVILQILSLLLIIKSCFALDKLYSVDPETLLSGKTDSWFESLTEDELKQYYSNDDGRSFSDKCEDLLNFEINIFIDVVLVGFDKTGNMKIEVFERELLQYLSNHNNLNQVHTLRSDRHDLPISVKRTFRVVKANPGLNKALSSSIQSAVTDHITSSSHKNDNNNTTNNNQHDDKYETVRIPYSITDNIISRHYDIESLSYSIYILNPILPLNNDKQIRYLYEGKGDSNEENTRCPGTRYMGKDRYAWIDLSAGPISFGPSFRGEGSVSQYSIVSLRYSFQGKSKKGKAMPVVDNVRNVPNYHIRFERFLSQLSTTIIHTTDMLILPPMDRALQRYTDKIELNIIFIHENNHNYIHDEILWEDIEHSLKEQTLTGQIFQLNQYHTSFDECQLCSASFSYASSSRMNSYLDGQEKFLDSQVIKDWLEHFENDFWKIEDNDDNNNDDENESILAPRKVTVFVYDMDIYQNILFEDGQDVVSFNDIIVAIQTKEQYYIDYMCDDIDLKNFQYDDGEYKMPSVTRTLYSAILQSLYGVAPTHELWNKPSNRIETDYVWSSSNTPFGPFSSTITNIPFSIKDSIKRNVVWSELTDVIDQLNILDKHFKQYEHAISDLLSTSLYVEFIRRYNVFSYKFDKCLHFLSVNNFEYSLFYIRSAQHDIAALHSFIHTALQSLEPVLRCSTIESTTSYEYYVKVTLIFVIPMILTYIVFNCEPKKSKRNMW